MQLYINKPPEKLEENTLKKYRTTLTHLKKHRSQLQFADIDNKMISDFHVYMQTTLKLEGAACQKYMEALKKSSVMRPKKIMSTLLILNRCLRTLESKYQKPKGFFWNQERSKHGGKYSLQKSNLNWNVIVISFSCTGPILGSLLASSLSDGARPLTIGMLGFGLALALPFSLFALFPAFLKSLPKSGNWMNTLKGAFAFIELALALKFLSNADLVKHLGLLKRETFLLIWAMIAFALSLWLVARAKGSYVVGFISLCLLIFSFYSGSGVLGFNNLTLLSGFPPPRSYSLS